MISPLGGRYVVLPKSDGRRPATSYRRTLLERRRIDRRRRRFLLLVAIAPLSAANALLGGPGGWELHVVSDFVLATYVVFLVESRRRRFERRTKVRILDRARSAPAHQDDFEFYEPVHAGSRRF